MGKRRPKPQVADEGEESDDPLGALVKTYRLEWRTVFYAISMMLFAAFSVLYFLFFVLVFPFIAHTFSKVVAYSLVALPFIICLIWVVIGIARDEFNTSPNAEIFLPRPLRFVMYGIFILVALYRLLRNIPNLWRRFEVRQKGVRFVQFGFGTEMRWKNVVDIDVRRYDRILHPLHFQFDTNSDETSPSLTRDDSGYTEFRVVIADRNGESIRLGRSFMCVVPNPQKMIASLRKRASLQT